MLLGFGHRQLNIDLLHFAVQLFNVKICGFADGERQVVWWPNFSSTIFEEQIARPYAGHLAAGVADGKGATIRRICLIEVRRNKRSCVAQRFWVAALSALR